MTTPEQIDRLQTSFVNLLFGRFGVAPADAYPVFDRLAAAYQEPGRYYHNLDHVAEVLKVVGRLGDLAANLPAVQLAAWFHDAVYDSRARDNEERSAELAAEVLRPLSVPEPTVSAVQTLIRATAHAGAEPADADAAVLLDADLSILGASEARYARYAEDVRREYAWVDEAAYRAGRARVLEGFLRRPRIYHTERMHAAGEEAARHNLRTEIAALAAGRPLPPVPPTVT